jgi:hypothetical protein
LNATLGPRERRPKQRLKMKHSRIDSTGTSSPSRMRPKLQLVSNLCRYTFLRDAYTDGKIMPPSLAMAYSSRLADVIHIMVPLIKHTPNMTVRNTAAPRLFVAWYMSSVIGILVDVDRTVSGSVKQKSITRINAMPLYDVNIIY